MILEVAHEETTGIDEGMLALTASVVSQAILDGTFLFDITSEAQAAGWRLDTLEHSSGRLVSLDCCPQCLAARTGAAAARSTGLGLAPSAPCAAPRPLSEGRP